MENLSVKIDFFKNLIKSGTDTRFWELDPLLNIIDTNADNQAFLHSLLTGCPECLNSVKNHIAAAEKRPLLLYDELGISWILTSEIANSTVLRLYIIGPVLSEEIMYSSFSANPRFYRLSSEMLKTAYETVQSLPLITNTSWLQLGNMFYYTINNEKIMFSDYVYHESRNKQFTVSNENKLLIEPGETTWLREQAILEKIENGDLNYKEAFSKMERSSYVLYSMSSCFVNGKGINLTRMLKDSIIAFITLCTRAAIRGGLDVNTAYLIGNRYLSEAELTDNKSELVKINTTMYKDYLMRVHNLKESEKTNLISACSNYIDLHIEEKLSADNIAKQLHYSSSYISHKFKDELNMTVSDYILKRKIEASKKYLTSSLSIADIAEKLNFCNSSYFINQFKKITGKTPQEFRNS